ncbi:MAG: radical SAM protein [Candidatus Omnitrophota bacterium]
MINFTKLLGGKPTVSEALKSVSQKREKPPAKSSCFFSPLVVFNITQRCNLKCKHCYLDSDNIIYKRELSLFQIKKTIDSLVCFNIPVLLLSGGEPLMHRHIFAIIKYAKSKHLRVGLSTNGTLISKQIAKKLKSTGIDYVGVSIDGACKTHDKFRNLKGAYARAIKGMRNAKDAGIKTGIRFTISKYNYKDLPQVLAMAVKEKIPRFCMYHLVYTGRGQLLTEYDLNNQERRKIVNFLLASTLEYNKKGVNLEILTVDNHADGIYIYNYLKKIKSQYADDVLALLKLHGGCSAGSKIVDINAKGDIFACQFWQDDVLGNVKKQDFKKIWTNQNNGLLCQLRVKSKYLKGKCQRCKYKSYCGGCRLRAKVVYNDYWQEDPGCYLTEQEITR